jgi:hypothetical protein
MQGVAVAGKFDLVEPTGLNRATTASRNPALVDRPRLSFSKKTAMLQQQAILS